LRLIVVRVHGNAVVRGGAVERSKKQLILPLGTIQGSGKKQLQTVAKLIAIANVTLVCTIASHFTPHDHFLQVPPSFGNDINDPQKSAGKILGRVSRLLKNRPATA
jgi:hypothetical protein